MTTDHPFGLPAATPYYAAFALAAALSACMYAKPEHSFFPLSDKHGKFGVAIRFDVYQDLGQRRVEDLVKELVVSSRYCPGGFVINETVTQGANVNYYGMCDGKHEK